MRYQFILTPESRALLNEAKSKNQQLLEQAEKNSAQAKTLFDKMDALLKELEAIVDEEDLPLSGWTSARKDHQKWCGSVKWHQLAHNWLVTFEHSPQRTYSTQEYTWLASNLQRRFPELDRLFVEFKIVDATPDVTLKDYQHPQNTSKTLLQQQYSKKKLNIKVLDITESDVDDMTDSPNDKKVSIMNK